MRTHFRIRHVLAVAFAFGLAGCFTLSRESPRLQLYVLGGRALSVTSAPTSGTPSSARAPFAVGLRRLNLASYLSVPAVMMRRGENTLYASEFHRWGGDIDQGINRAVGTYLGALPVVRNVDVAPWPTGARHDVLVQLNISRFEGVVDSAATAGRVHVVAGWDIIRALDGAVLVRGTTDDRGGAFRSGDYAGLVSGLDAALERVAGDIGACLARFPNDSTPPASCGSVSAGGSGAGR